MNKWKNINLNILLVLLLMPAAGLLNAEIKNPEKDDSEVKPFNAMPENIVANNQEAATGFEDIDAFILNQNVDKTKPNWKTRLNKPPQLTFDKNKQYFWVLETNKGVMEIKLMPNVAPMHVSSTIYLTRLGFYDDTIFHRVIQGFMAQGGDPLGTGRGGPGYKYSGEFQRYITHNRPGLLSMANAGPGTDGSQFFLTFVATPHLDGKHTIFGEIVKGRDTLRQLEARGSRSGATREPLILVNASVRIQ